MCSPLFVLLQGCVTVSERYAARLRSKLSLYWGTRSIAAIPNAVEREGEGVEGEEGEPKGGRGEEGQGAGVSVTGVQRGTEVLEMKVLRLLLSKGAAKREWLASQGLGIRGVPQPPHGAADTATTAAANASDVAPAQPASDDSRLFVFLGRHSYQKGSDIIAAMADVMLERHRGAIFVVVGPVADACGERAVQVGEDERVGACASTP